MATFIKLVNSTDENASRITIGFFLLKDGHALDWWVCFDAVFPKVRSTGDTRIQLPYSIYASLFLMLTRTSGNHHKFTKQLRVRQHIRSLLSQLYSHNNEPPVARTGKHPCLPPGWIILLTRAGYCSNTCSTDITHLVYNAKACCPTGYKGCWSGTGLV